MEQIEEIERISKPIIEYIKNNYNPHTTVIINEDCIKVVSDEVNIPYKEKKC